MAESSARATGIVSQVWGSTPSGTSVQMRADCQVVAADYLLPRPPVFPVRFSLAPAFHGQTPDEMYFGTGDSVPGTLAVAKMAAQEARLHANRVLACDERAGLDVGAGGTGVVAA